MRRSSLLLAISLVLAAGLSCQKGPEEPQPSRAIFCLFDISGSTSSPEVRQRYMEEFRGLLDAVRDGDLLMGDVITANTLATASYPIRQQFPTLERFGNPADHQVRLKRQKREALAKARQLILESEPAESTDLLNAFYLPARVLNGELGAGRDAKGLVVFSDMIVQNESHDFTGIDLTEARIQEIIDAQREAQGRLPDLTGVRVWVVGAGAAPEGGGLEPKKLKQIEKFWRMYFEACGATLPSENYGAALLSFELGPGPSSGDAEPM